MSDDLTPQQATGETRQELALHGTSQARMLAPGEMLADSLAGTEHGRPTALRRSLTLGMLLPHKWLVLAIFVVSSVATLAALWELYPPTYEAWAIVEVSPTIPRILYRTEDNGVIPLFQQYLNDQAAVLHGPTVLQRALDDPDVRKTAWYARRPRFGAPPSALERLQTDLSVSPRRTTSLVDVKMTARAPQEAALIANAVVDQYLRHVSERASRIDDEVYREVKQQHDDLRNKMEALRGDIDRLRGEVGHWAPEELLKQQSNRLDAKRAERQALEDRLRVAQWQRAQLVSLSTQPAASAPAEGRSDTQPPYDADAEWRRLNTELQAATDRIAAEQYLGEAHPTMVKLRGTVEQARKRLAEREAQVNELWRTRPQLLVGTGGEAGAGTSLAKLEAEIRQLEFEKGLKNADIQDEEKRASQTGDAARLLQKNLDELHDIEARFRDIRERKFTMEIERRAPASISIQARAYPPSEPSNGRRRVMLGGLGIVGGLLAGLLAAYVRASTTSVVQDAGDLVDNTAVRLLGHVPLVSGAEPCSNPLHAECIRMIRTALIQRLEAGRGTAIQITSAGPGAGKTTIALMLAESLAACGKRVLLVDADVRNPSLHTRCALDPEPGLIGLLKAGATDEGAIMRHPNSGVSILPAGRMGHGVDGELLANGLLVTRLNRWRTKYDFVLLDTPPIIPVADARILAGQVDSTVLVVRERHCSRLAVLEALALLERTGGRLLGVVFIGNQRRGGEYHRYYRSYYSGAAANTPESR